VGVFGLPSAMFSEASSARGLVRESEALVAESCVTGGRT
jgi:hypothetical protein